MSTPKRTKLNKLLQQWPESTVATSEWLRSIGVTKELQKTYKNSGWIRRIGVGAVVRNQYIPWPGAVYALQQQLKLPVHIAGRSALQLHGQSHYISMRNRLEHLWMPRGTHLPRWFVRNWGQETQVTVSNMLPALQGLTRWEQGHIVLCLSTPERAMMECAFQVPKQCSFDEALQLMQGLTTLRPQVVQNLLQHCTNIKVKRLFLLLAHRTRQPWFPFVDVRSIHLGTGPRQVVPGEQLDKTYGITVPPGEKE